MPRLILINGLPGVGKSTLARMLADQCPLMLVLDIDVVRGLLGRWEERRGDAGIAARRMALEMARSHLESGSDVVVPQFLGKVEFVLQLEELCASTQATFREVMLHIATAEEAADRFSARTLNPESQQHRDAVAGLAAGGSVDEFVGMQARLDEVLAVRPATVEVMSVFGDIEGTFRRLLAAVE